MGTGTDAPSTSTLEMLTWINSDKNKLTDNGISRLLVGKLNLPTGRIIAVDPLTLFGAESIFRQTVPAGQYSVEVFEVDDREWGKRIALASIIFSNKSPITWKLALVGDQNVAELKPDELFGYGVDTGLGSFLSPEALSALEDSIKKAELEIQNFTNYYEDVLAEDLESRMPCILMHEPATNPKMNISIFSSGLGDGYYPSYFGYDENDLPVTLATVFFIPDMVERNDSTELGKNQ